MNKWIMKKSSSQDNKIFPFFVFMIWLTILQPSFPLSITPAPSKSTCNKIVWFRDHGLRIQDNEALYNAIKACQQHTTNVQSSADDQSSPMIIPIYLWNRDPYQDSSGGGTASELFIAHTLKFINEQLDGNLGQGFIDGIDEDKFLQGHINSLQQDTIIMNLNTFVKKRAAIVVKELLSICEATSSTDIYYISSSDTIYEEALKKLLQEENGITVHTFHGCSLLNYSSKEDIPWKEIILEHPFRSPLIPFVDFVLKKLSNTPPSKPIQIQLDTLLSSLSNIGVINPKVFRNPVDIDCLLQKLGKSYGGTEWGRTILGSFSINESKINQDLDSFLISLGSKENSEKQTHFTSRISPYLARGLLSPRQVYHSIISSGVDKEKDSFVRRICWRDYTHAVVSLYPDVLYGVPIRDGYDDGSCDVLDREKMNLFEMWKKGSTGIPLVDAGMRQLIVEGFMPQKVRLACSTCLVEGLNIPWQFGMQHFKNYLVDYDININCNMWMNAGCVGLDPYYCGMKYRKRSYWDNDGSYVREWCPELKSLPDRIVLDQGKGVTKTIDCLYEPWSVPNNILEEANVKLGVNYPFRICDDRTNRQNFFNQLRQKRTEWPQNQIDDSKRDVVMLGRDLGAEKIGLFTPRALQIRSR